MPSNVIIMRGVPGSGKSTYQAKRVPGYHVVCSTDDHPGLYDEDGKFHPELLGEAHASNLRNFIYHIVESNTRYDSTTVVVDNTNITVAELAPYVQIALAYGKEVTVITLMGDPDIAARRNVHGVPENRVFSMYDMLIKETDNFPKFWSFNPLFSHEIVEVKP